MKFIDEAIVKVKAGNGGRGAIGFRREKFVPFGGPDGGDGGAGGSVWLRAQQGMNTLVDYRVQRTFRAGNGQPGGGQDCTGRGGDDLFVPMPVGTVVTRRRDRRDARGPFQGRADAPRREGRQGRLGQPAIQELDQPYAEAKRAWTARARREAFASNCGCLPTSGCSACRMPANQR